jgi:hypothetical protein
MFRRNLRYWYEVAICVVILVIILVIYPGLSRVVSTLRLPDE